MPRIRIIFEKKGWITFLNHQDLPVLFSRAARRAGLSQEFTEGFSPHPRISLGPALAAGVVGSNEPADFWFNVWDSSCAEKWNEKLTIYKEIYLKGDHYYYAYDTKLKKLVILDPKDLRIIY